MFKLNETEYKLLGNFISYGKALPDLYVMDKIPTGKLNNALNNFADPDDMPVAIIDATVFGSCKLGMAIGLKGIYWKNDSDQSRFLSWETLSEQSHEISMGVFSTHLPNGNKFDSSGSKISKIDLINLLFDVIEYYKKTSSKNLQIDQEIYIELISEFLSVLISMESDIDSTKLEIATEIISNDKLITNKEKAIESLLVFTNKHIEEKEKSNSLTKLRLLKITHKIKNAINHTENRTIENTINMILELMLDPSRDSDLKVKETIETAINNS